MEVVGFVFAPALAAPGIGKMLVAGAAAVVGAVGTVWSLREQLAPSPEILWRDPPKPEAITDPTVTTQAETGSRQTAERPALPSEQLLLPQPPTPLMETVEQTIQQPRVERPEAPVSSDFTPDLRVEPIQGPNPSQYVGGWNFTPALDTWPDDQYFQGSFAGVQDIRTLSADADAVQYGVLTKFTNGIRTFVPYVQTTYMGRQTYLWVSTAELAAVPNQSDYGLEIFRYMEWQGEYFSFTPENLEYDGGMAASRPSTYVAAQAPAPVAEKKKELAPLIEPQTQTIDLTAPNDLVDADATTQIWEKLDAIATPDGLVTPGDQALPVPLVLAPPIDLAWPDFPRTRDDGRAPIPAPIPIPTTGADVHVPYPGAAPVNPAGTRASLRAIAAEVGRIEQKNGIIGAAVDALSGVIGGGGNGGGGEKEVDGTTYTLTGVCETPDDSGNQPVFSTPIGKQAYSDAVIARLDAMQYLLQAHLGYRTPTCGSTKPQLFPFWRSIRFESDEYTVDGRNVARKLLRYRGNRAGDVDFLGEYWADFEWETGPVVVWHKGTGVGTPQVWASTEAEGKRVLRHAFGEAGIDPDQAGEWGVSSSDHPRYGVRHTVRLKCVDGCWSATARPGPDGFPEAAVAWLDP